MRDLLLIGGATDEMLARLGAVFTIHKHAEIADFATWAERHGEQIAAIATNGHAGVPPEMMAALPQLKVISCYGVGYDAIDTEACVARGIKVSHTPDVLNAEVANTAILLLLACYRNFLADEKHARSGAWEKQGNAALSRSPDHRRIGLLGMGRIGQEIARRLQIFAPEIHYHSRSAKDVPYSYQPDLLEMARQCDVLICITPGGAATEKLVNAPVLDALGPEGVLINVSRGSVVDEAALVEALASGALGAAGLDVFEAEPHIPAALKASDRTVLLPHVGSATVETRAAMGALVVDNLLQWLADGSVKTPVPECAHL